MHACMHNNYYDCICLYNYICHTMSSSHSWLSILSKLDAEMAVPLIVIKSLLGPATIYIYIIIMHACAMNAKHACMPWSLLWLFWSDFDLKMFDSDLRKKSCKVTFDFGRSACIIMYINTRIYTCMHNIFIPIAGSSVSSSLSSSLSCFKGADFLYKTKQNMHACMHASMHGANLLHLAPIAEDAWQSDVCLSRTLIGRRTRHFVHLPSTNADSLRPICMYKITRCSESIHLVRIIYHNDLKLWGMIVNLGYYNYIYIYTWRSFIPASLISMSWIHPPNLHECMQAYIMRSIHACIIMLLLLYTRMLCQLQFHAVALRWNTLEENLVMTSIQPLWQTT